MRKYLFNAGVLSALLSAFGIIRKTISGPRDWRLVLNWASWAISLIIAIGAITSPEDEEPEDSTLKKKRRR